MVAWLSEPCVKNFVYASHGSESHATINSYAFPL